MRVACVVLFATSVSLSPMFPLAVEGEDAVTSGQQEGAMGVHGVTADLIGGGELDTSHYGLAPLYAVQIPIAGDNWYIVMSMLVGLMAARQTPALDGVRQPAHDPHIRPLEKDADRLIARGTERSATFRRLMTRLDQSDVIVYVRLSWNLPLHMGGRLLFLAVHGESRYLVIDLNRELARSALVALLGHELQHAVEVADAADVTSSADLKALYRRVGIQTGPDRYDSLAARRAGYDILQEAAASRRHAMRAASAMGSLTEIAE